MCLFKAGLDHPSDDSESLPRSLGDYQLLEQLGNGAHGTVYRAHRRGLDRPVAVKVLHGDNPELEIANLVQLTHPNIVYVFDRGHPQAEPPYFAMPWYEGGALDRAQWRRYFCIPGRAIELVIVLAEAVQYAHDRAILHGDIKPANILIDSQKRPHISDFSVSRQLRSYDESGPESIAGTPAYMAPEQAGASSHPLTTRTDVYGLGTVLYELLTDMRVREASGVEELLLSFEGRREPPPLGLPPVLADLEQVCLRALRFNPDERYRSPAALAADLRRVQAGDWIRDRRPNRLQRSLRWTREHPWVAAIVAFGALILSSTQGLAFEHLQAQKRDLEERVLRVNAALAKAQAQVALGELRRLRSAVMNASVRHEPHLHGLLAGNRARVRDPGFAIPGFDSLWVTGCDGFTLANSAAEALRASRPRRHIPIAFAFRDYFRGTMALADKAKTHPVYVSRAIRSSSDSRYKLVFGTPILAGASGLTPCLPNTSVVGGLFAGRTASSTLGDLQVPELQGSGQQTSLLGLRDRDSAEEPLPPTYTVLVHEHLRFGDSRPVGRHLSERLRDHFGRFAAARDQFESIRGRPLVESGYQSALAPAGTHLLGAFYPVGHTGLVVAVETSYRSTTSLLSRLEDLVFAHLAFLAFCLVAAWVGIRRSRLRHRRRAEALEAVSPSG